MNLNQEIAHRVIKKRKSNNYSQQDIADMLGVSRPNYVNIEAGRQSLKARHIYNLCRIFKCLPTSLFPKVVPAKIKSRIIKKIIVIRPKKSYLKIE